MSITTKQIEAAVERLSKITGQDLQYVAHQYRSHNHRVSFKDQSRVDLLSGKTKGQLLDQIEAFITGYNFPRQQGA